MMSSRIPLHTFDAFSKCNRCREPKPQNADEAMQRLREHKAWQLLQIREAQLLPHCNMLIPPHHHILPEQTLRQELSKFGFATQLDALETEVAHRHRPVAEPKDRPSTTGWGNFAAAIKQDDQALISQVQEGLDRFASINGGTEIQETYIDQQGKTVKTVYKNVAGRALENETNLQKEREANVYTGNPDLGPREDNHLFNDESNDESKSLSKASNADKTQAKTDVTKVAREEHLDTLRGVIYVLDHLHEAPDQAIILSGCRDFLAERKKALEQVPNGEQE